MHQRPRLRFKEVTGCPVSSLEGSTRRASTETLALIPNPPIDFPAFHACQEIRQMKRKPSCGQGWCAVCRKIAGIMDDDLPLDSIAPFNIPFECAKESNPHIANRSKSSTRSKERYHATQSKRRLAG